MKKIISALLLLSLFLVGCSEDKPIETTVVTPPQEVENPNQPAQPAYESITLGDAELSAYQIVYQPNPFKRQATSFPDSFTYGDTDYYRLIANELAAKLQELTGVKLAVVSEAAATTANEIRIGNVKRTGVSYDDLGVYAYQINQNAGVLSICGGSAGSVYHALDALYAEFAGQNSKNVKIADGTDLSGEADLITVACIGDSVTAGYGSASAQYCAYPAVLQRILWKDYIVYNYGNSGKTMRDDLNDAYSKTTTYQDMMKGAADADITLIMLGTNDSNRDRSWTDADTQSFNDSCKKLVSAIEEKRPDMTYFIMNCPVYQGNDNFGSAQVRELQSALVESLKAEGFDMQFFDMYNYSKRTITIENFPDGLHPGDKGYAMMANGVAEMLEAYRNGKS